MTPIPNDLDPFVSQGLEAKLEELKKVRVEKTFESHSNNKMPLSMTAKSEHQHNKDTGSGGGGGGGEMSEEEKAKQKSKPISSTQVPGTPWCVVWTKDKRVFFYNASEKASLWERPAALVGRVDVDKMVKECPAVAAAANNEQPSAAGKKKAAVPESTQVEPPTKKPK